MTTQERNDLISIMSDMHKDAYGFRPRNINYSAMTDEQLEAELNEYQEIIKRDLEEEAIMLEKDLKEFDELVEKTINMGAGNRETAIRWIVEGADDWDAEAIVWRMGILYCDKGRALVKEIQETCDDLLQMAYEK